MIKKIDKQYKDFNRFSWFILIGGFLAFILGLLKMFFSEPSIGINLKTQQPVIISGSILILVGIVFFVIGLYRVINKTKAFKNQIDIENELQDIEEKKRKKMMGY